MKKKIEQFDNYGVDLSKTSKHKSIPGGIFSIFAIILTSSIIWLMLSNYIIQTDSVSMKYIIDFEGVEIAQIDWNQNYIAGNFTKTLASTESTSDITLLSNYYRFGIEYQLSEDVDNTNIILSECEFISNACVFNISLSNDYFRYHEGNAAPKFIYESCESLKKNLTKISNPEKLGGCDSEISQFYNWDFIKDNYFLLSYSWKHYQVKADATFEVYPISYMLLFQFIKQNNDIYQSEISKINVQYTNKLFSYETHNHTYANWFTPMLLVGSTENEDYVLNLIFSFRWDDEIIYYQITKSSFFATWVSIGGIWKLITLIYSISSWWNTYYMQRALFKVAELYKEDVPKEEEPLDINWDTMSYCGWFWLTCCCNCSKKKKQLKERYKQLLENYQCKSYIRSNTESQWFDISKWMVDNDTEIDEVLRESQVRNEIDDIKKKIENNE